MRNPILDALDNLPQSEYIVSILLGSEMLLEGINVIPGDSAFTLDLEVSKRIFEITERVKEGETGVILATPMDIEYGNALFHIANGAVTLVNKHAASSMFERIWVGKGEPPTPDHFI